MSHTTDTDVKQRYATWKNHGTGRSRGEISISISMRTFYDN